ncbi:MAG: PDZ domain-containing protein [Acidobacteria bacterium]|nr:PDZ domain-containing protein [Acidobacteriota bacterium]
MIRKSLLICMLALMTAAAWAGQPVAEPEALAMLAQQAVRVSIGGSFLGVGVAEVDSDRAKALKLSEESGVEITNIEENSPAAKAGLQKGDVVLEYNGQRVVGTEQFVRLVRETPAGRQVKMLINRGGAAQTVTATVDRRTARRSTGTFAMPRFEMPDIDIRIPDIPRANMSWRSPVLGVEAESIESQLAEYFGVKEGVLVRSVVKNSAAEKAGLKAGDVIIKVDAAKVTSPRDVSNAVRNKRAGTFPVTLMRERKETTLNVTIEEPQKSEREIRPRARTVRSAPSEKF